MDENTVEQSNNRVKQLAGLKPYKKGESGNLQGRPKGKTMKEFAREFLMAMSDEKKLKFLNSLSKDVVWKMAEGNPESSTEISGKDGQPIQVTLVDLIKKADESRLRD